MSRTRCSAQAVRRRAGTSGPHSSLKHGPRLCSASLRAAPRPGHERGICTQLFQRSSLRAQRSNPESHRGGTLDCFAALAMTEQEAAASLFQIRIVVADTLSRPRGLFRPSFASVASPSPERGRREVRMPAGHPRSTVRKVATRICTAAYRCSQDIPAFPAQWFYGLCRALLGERCTIAPVASRMADALARSGNTHLRKT